jgi:hypothetical protein
MPKPALLNRIRSASVSMSLVMLAAFTACTATEFSRTPQMQRAGEIFITQESLNQPYESLGLVQVTRRGARIFGFIDPAGTDMPDAMAQLEAEVRRSGADGAMNVRVIGQPVHTGTKILGLIFFFIPFSNEVTVTAELVRLPRTAPL